MRHKIINRFLILITFTFLNCGIDKSEEVALSYKSGNQEVKIEIENGKNYIEYNKPTKTDFVLTNIDMNTFSVNGLGIRIIDVEEGVMKTEINVPKEYSEKDTLNIKIQFGEERKKCEFNIPLTKTE